MEEKNLEIFNFNTPLSLRNMQIKDAFWKNEMELVRREVLPYQWNALNDRVEGAAPSFCMRNFRIAGKLNHQRREQGQEFQEPKYTFRGFEALPEDPEHLEDKFYGFVFQDSDFSKWIEAVGYSLAQHPDPELEKTADEAIELVCAAQQEDGYLDTYYIINGRDKTFTNLRDNHELYCFGHLVEGAVAYYEATGKDRLLNAARRFADYIDGYFGPEEGKCKGYPGHEIAEMALVRLYEATGEDRYLQLSRFFIDERGKQPCYFGQEKHECGHEDADKKQIKYEYHQAHLPVRQQAEAVGHAVRAVYLYSGMADIARLTKDESLYAACRRLWESIVNEKMYVTAGIGGTHIGEAFSFPYDLPDDTAYAETCASIGLAFFARRMLEIAPEAEYANVMERALYNGILSGMALDGKSFFYVNPLSVNPQACQKDERKFHVKAVRQKWFGCACCPPNIARLVSSVAAYAYTENEDTLWTHLYIGGEITKRAGESQLTLRMESGIPWDGRAKMTVQAGEPVNCTLAFRLPGWCGNEAPAITAPDGIERTDRDGYCYLTGNWSDGDVVALDFPMKTRLVRANNRVREDLGKLAVLRGPITYCLEEADNGPDLHLCRIDPAHIGEAKTVHMEIDGVKLDRLELPGLREEPDNGPLYWEYAPARTRPVTLKFIPYFAWANRGEGEMLVWVRSGADY